MPDSLFHFLFPVISALAARVHLKHNLRNIFIAGLFAVLIDLDHIWGIPRATLHNVFVTTLIPILLIFYTFYFRKNDSWKSFSILLLIFLSSHPTADFFAEGPIAFFYPLSDKFYTINFNIMIQQGLLISSSGVGLLIFFLLIILPCYFLDEIIEITEKRHESIRKAIKDILRS